jgi:putative ABC transport system permease protein
MNKYLQYFRQAWNLLRQEKLFGGIYIAGTGLSVTVVMMLSIVYYIRIANIYPETNRDRLLIVGRATERMKDGTNARHAGLSLNVVESCFAPLRSAEAVTAVHRTGERNRIQMEGSDEQLRVEVKYVDTNFWTVFPFRFVSGRPFDGAEFRSGMRTAVIAESLARRLFGTTDVAGRQISFNFYPCRICGVVKDAPFAAKWSYAQLWAPYTVHDRHRNTFGAEGTLGSMTAYLLAPSAGKTGEVKREAKENLRRYNGTLRDVEVEVHGQPDSQWQAVFRPDGEGAPDFAAILLRYGALFFVFLLVPAVSLSGMTDSRMERRMAEMGVRRAFGAPVRSLTGQIMTENLLFTFLGGAVGLLASYTIILLGRNWILQIGMSTPDILPAGADVMFTPSMLLNLPVFAITLAICFLLNLMSAMIPAWRHARRAIVYSLHANNQLSC